MTLRHGEPKRRTPGYSTTQSPTKSGLGTRGDTCPGFLVLSAEHEPVLTHSNEDIIEDRYVVSASFGKCRVGLGCGYESEGVLRAVGWHGRGEGGVAWTMK
jgi:hypothetical protein